MDFPTEKDEFQRCWSSAAGELAAMKEAIAEAEKRSAETFVRRRDEVAKALRDLAYELSHRRDKMSARVSGFIEEDKRRRYEETKMLRH